jgi:hypothetical protein
MRPGPLVLAVLAAAALAAALAPGVAGARTSSCDQAGDWCVFTYHRHGQVLLEVRSFGRFWSHLRVCVTGPRAPRRECVPITLRRVKVYVARTSWPKRFHQHGDGLYRVRFYADGHRLGRRLSFRVPAHR